MDNYKELREHAAHLIQHEKWEEALVIVDELTRISPDNHVMAYNRGMVHWKLGDLPSTDYWLSRTLELQNDFEPAIHAKKQLEMELHKDYMNRVSDCMACEDWNKALTYLTEMTDRWPDNPKYNYHLSVVQYKLGDCDAACERLHKLLELYPDHHQVKETLLEVEESLRKQILESENKTGAQECEELPDDDWTPLHYAAMEGRANAIQHLIDSGSDINVKDNDGETPLYYAIMNGHTDIAILLISNGADIIEKGNNGMTPLHEAAAWGNPVIVKLLVENGVKINDQDNFGKTPLKHAVTKGHANVVKVLIDSGADVNMKNNDGWTPLYCAVVEGFTDIVKLLVDAGAEINTKISSGRTPLEYALWKGQEDIIEILEERVNIVNS
ncbi:MAG: ankyrin repeat domain-containing protein [bacterium]